MNFQILQCFKDFPPRFRSLRCYCYLLLLFSRLIQIFLFTVFQLDPLQPLSNHLKNGNDKRVHSLHTSPLKQWKNWMDANWRQQHLSSWASTDWVVLETVIFVIAKLCIRSWLHAPSNPSIHLAKKHTRTKNNNSYFMTRGTYQFANSEYSP